MHFCKFLIFLPVLLVLFSCRDNSIGQETEVEVIRSRCILDKRAPGYKGDFNLPVLEVVLKNSSKTKVGILTKRTNIAFSIPGDLSTNPPCSDWNNENSGFSVNSDSVSIQLDLIHSSFGGFIISPNTDTIIYLSVNRLDSGKWESKETVLDKVFCQGNLSYSAPCDTVRADFFQEGVKWVNKIRF